MSFPARRLRDALVSIVMSLSFAAATDASATTRIERVTTPAGIEVWLVHDSTVPLVSMEFAVRGGAAQDPPGKGGLASLAAALLDEGAGDLDAAAFQTRLEETAVEIRFSASHDVLRGSLKTLSENAATAFDLLALSINKPRFDAEAIDRIRAQTLAGLRRRSTNASALASETLWATAFPGHPYGRPVEGTMESVPTITADDLRGYARRVFARGTLKVAVVGDISAADLVPLVDRVFGALPAGETLTPIAEVTPQGLGLRKVVDLDVPQSVLAFAWSGIKRADPDFIPAFVLNDILGGGTFSSRLYREVREKRGLAYSVYSYLMPLDHAGLIVGGVATRNDRAAESLSVIESEIRRLASDGPTADELEKTKKYLIGSYALRFDTSGKIAGQLLQIQLDGLGIDYIDRRNGLIAAVTIDDIRRVGRRLLDHARLLVSVAGRPVGIAAN